MKKAHADADIPLHKQAEALIRDWVVSEKYAAGDQLPAARELAAQLGTHEQTIRRSLKRLIEEGLLRGAQGKGVFVREPAPRHGRIALVLPNLEHELTVQIARGAQETLDAAGFQTLILDGRHDPAKENANIANLPGLPVDGAIIFPISHGDIGERIFQLKAEGIPLVLVDKHLPGLAVDCVLADDYGGSYALTAALIRQGVARFAWLGGETGASTVEERLDGFRWALGDHGIPLARDRVFRIGSPSGSGRHASVPDALDSFCEKDRSGRDAAVICANDLLALEALAHLSKRGLKIPEDIKVTGFDDSSAGERALLTSVKKPVVEMGGRAAELLLRRLRHRSAPCERVILPTEPVFRKSTQAL